MVFPELNKQETWNLEPGTCPPFDDTQGVPIPIGTAYGGKPGTRNPELESMLSVQPLICVPFARHMSRRSGVPIDKVLAEHHFKWARIYLRNDDVVEVHLHPGKYNGEKVLGVIEEIKRLRNKPHLLILTLPHKRSMSTLSGVQAVFSKPGVDYSMAKAYVFASYFQYIIAKAGRLYFRPIAPMRFFRKREQAEAWLKSFQGYGI